MLRLQVESFESWFSYIKINAFGILRDLAHLINAVTDTEGVKSFEDIDGQMTRYYKLFY